MKRLELDYLREAEIKARAAAVLKRHQCSVPVDPRTIIEAEPELRLHYDDYKDAYEGAIEYTEEDDKYDIYINTSATQDPNRERFTLAHELGHFFINEHQFDLASGKVPFFRFQPNLQRNHAEALAELEANVFASHLLMPTTRLRAAIEALKALDDSIMGSSAGIISGLAKEFRVSFQCAASRYLELTDRVCAILVYPKSEARVPWVEVSDSFEKNFGISRNARLKPFPAGHRLLQSWFHGVIPSRQDQWVSTDVRKGQHDISVFLEAFLH